VIPRGRPLPQTITALLLAATALIGVAHTAFLPPWEGFDETAHWSYIQELADRGRPPRYGFDTLGADIDAFSGPLPYSGAAPFEKTGRPTYRDYRQSGARPIAAGPTRYAPGRGLNWQAQHPPLYYLIMVPVYRAAHGLGWVDHLLVLRLASFALAFMGFALGVLATARFAAKGFETPSGGAWISPILAAWPFLFPQFFPQFARLGNDSLCLLLMGATWAFLLRLLTGGGGWRSAAALGATLGLGLLTKAFFLPIGAGVGGMLLLRAWVSHRSGRFAELVGQAVLAGSVALIIGGWWYAAKRLETGSFTGSDEFIHLNQSGGAATLVDGFSISEFAQGMAALPTTFVWAGTWSLAELPQVLLIPSLAILAVVLFDYAVTLRRADLSAWAPIALTLPMATGLIYHVFVWMAGAGAFTPGWYFHILAAPLGFAVALGRRRSRLMTVLIACTGVFTIVAWAFQLSMFSGCAAKLGADKHYTLTGAGCFIDLHVLERLGHPLLGFAALFVGAALSTAAGISALRALRPATNAPTGEQPL
jgi:hypothetical protein